jgi:predicted permease
MLYAWTEEHREARSVGLLALLGFWIRTLAHATMFGVLERVSSRSPSRQREPSRGKPGFSLENVRNDLRIALRGLGRAPGFTVTAVITLALGLGGTAAIFTVLNRVVLDPLPYPQPERMVSLTNRVPGVAMDAEWNMSTAQFVYFSEQSTAFDGMGLYRGFGANIDTPEGPHRTSGWSVTAGVFPLLGATALHGRVISEADDQPGAPSVAVLALGFWRRQFGSDPSVIGKIFSINDTPYEIIGILNGEARMPGALQGAPGDLWVPMQIDRNGYFGNNHVFPMVARLAPGITAEYAEQELAALTARLPERFPDAYSTAFFERYGFRTKLTPLRDAVIGSVARTLWIVFGGVGLVLLIAITNVANLLLVRVEGRQQEVSVRRALGASGWSLSRHILVESCVLALSGGALALLLGSWGVPALFSLAPKTLPRGDGLNIDATTMLFTLGLSLVVGICLAAYAGLHMRGSGFSQLISGERSTTSSRGRQRARGGLIIAQVALALTLMAGAGLLLQSMTRLNRIEPGFESEGVVTAGIYLTPGRYTDDRDIWAAYQAMLDRIRAIPGVSAAGMSEELPVLANFGCTVQGFEDPQVIERIKDAGMTTCAGQEPTTPGYFEAMGIPILQGRGFSDEDNADPTRGAVVVSRAFAQRFWPGEDPLGKGVMPSGRSEGPPYHVIGVVGDVPAGSLDGGPAIAVYYPIVHNPNTPGRWDW